MASDLRCDTFWHCKFSVKKCKLACSKQPQKFYNKARMLTVTITLDQSKNPTLNKSLGPPSSIHPFLHLFPLIRSGWGGNVLSRIFPRHIFQFLLLLLVSPKAFPGQKRCIISLSTSGSTIRGSSQFSRKSSNRSAQEALTKNSDCNLRCLSSSLFRCIL